MQIGLAVKIVFVKFWGKAQIWGGGQLPQAPMSTCLAVGQLERIPDNYYRPRMA